MKTMILVCLTLSTASVVLAQDAGPKNVVEHHSGFITIRSPLKVWEMNSEHRLDGAVSDAIKWENIERIYVLHTLFAGINDAENLIKKTFSEGQLVKNIPGGVRIVGEEQEKTIGLVALVQLKDGSCALITVMDRCVVIEHNLKFGMVIRR